MHRPAMSMALLSGAVLGGCGHDEASNSVILPPRAAIMCSATPCTLAKPSASPRPSASVASPRPSASVASPQPGPSPTQAGTQGPGPAPSPSLPSPSPTPSGGPFAATIVFAAALAPGGPAGLFLYDTATSQIKALPGANGTDGLEDADPSLSADGRWIVYQVTRAAASGPTHTEIRLFDRESETVNTLNELNSPLDDQRDPALSADGRAIAYIHRAAGEAPDLRVFDTRTHADRALPAAGSGFGTILCPAFAPDGHRLAFAASPATAATPDASDVTTNLYLYDLTSTPPALITPGDLNSPADQRDPAFSPDGDALLFVSNRLGVEDVFEADLASGAIDNLTLLNSALPCAGRTKRHPRYLASRDRILFQWRPAAGSPVDAQALFDRASGELDLLTTLNLLLSASVPSPTPTATATAAPAAPP